MTEYANVPPHRSRWMEMVVDDQKGVDWFGVHLLTTSITLAMFLDLEEVALVKADRAKAWEEFLQKNPDLAKMKSVQPDPADFIPDQKTANFTPRPKF